MKETYANGVIKDGRGVKLGELKQGVVRDAAGRKQGDFWNGYVRDSNGRNLLALHSGTVTTTTGKRLGKVSQFTIKGMERESDGNIVAVYHFLIKKLV